MNDFSINSFELIIPITYCQIKQRKRNIYEIKKARLRYSIILLVDRNLSYGEFFCVYDEYMYKYIKVNQHVHRMSAIYASASAHIQYSSRIIGAQIVIRNLRFIFIIL